MTRTTLLSVAVACVTLAALIAVAAPPQLIRYQGRLTDDAGVPLTGNHDISFAVYDADSGGSVLWSEGPRSVTLSNGVLDILMGEVTPIPSSVFASSDRWLEVSADGTTLAPRQRLSSVPYAHASDRLAGNDAAFFLDTSPTGQTKQGPLTLQGELTLDGDGDGQNDTQIIDVTSSTMILTKWSDGNALIDLNPRPTDGTSDARVRLFRNTNTTGSKFVSFQHGDDTTTEDARIGVDGLNSFFQMGGGNVGIGTTTPGQKLDVDGPARVERLEVTGQLGSASTPEAGALYRDSLVKAWASTDAAGTLLDGFNLTVTQTGTGIYAYTFRRAMGTAVYAVNATNNASPVSYVKVQNKTTNGFTVITNNPTGGLVDREHDVIVVGN